MALMIFKALYTLNPDAIDKRLKANQMNLMNWTPEQQAKRAAFAARGEELHNARKKSRSPEEKARIREEMKKLSTEESALIGEIAAGAVSGWNEKTRSSTDSLPPKQMKIRLAVNRNADVQHIANPFQVQGVPLAF